MGCGFIRLMNLEAPMAHYHTVIDTKPVRSRRAEVRTALNGVLGATAVLFGVAVICGVLP